MIGHQKKVFVAMSGGVDSSVAAYLLKNQGYDVTGVFMRCWSQGSSDALGIGEPCGSERDAEDARRVAGHISIPFFVWDFEKEYKSRVVNYMIEGYREGVTPNPDVMCNKEIKFGLFFEKARALGADYVSTGHYVRLEDGDTLFEAKDKNKDQSYFLWTLTQDKLAHCLFPIGEYLKSEVRDIARQAGLPTAEKKDSQGICFLGKVGIHEFLKEYIPTKRGEVLASSGDAIGTHEGAEFYTIGQRHGIGNMKHEKGMKMHEPLYIAAKDVHENTVTVVSGNEHPALYKKEICLREVNFIHPLPPLIRANSRMEVRARVRYRQPLSKAELRIENRAYRLVFDEPQKFVAPGQSAVFYSGNPSTSHSTQRVSDPMGSGSKSTDFEMVGGGVIV